MIKKILFGSVSVAAIFLAMSQLASAQEKKDVENKAQTQKSELEEVVVTGFKLQNRAAIQAKRDNVQISDSISADDIASLPDFSIAESLQRIPGISTALDNGEDRFVIVRGLNSQFNFSTIDGLILPSTDAATRSVLFDIIPSSVVKRVDVLKSFTADLDGQAIGGRIDLVTRSAFDHDGIFLGANAGVELRGKKSQGPKGIDPSTRLDVAFSTTFGADDSFGFVFAGNYNKREFNTVAPTHSGARGYQFYTESGARAKFIEDSTGIPNPEFFTSFLFENERERIGGLTKLEYKSPSSDFYSSVTGFYFQRQDAERRYQHRLRNRDLGKIPENFTNTGGVFTGRGEGAVEGTENLFDDYTAGVQGGFDYGWGGLNRLSGKVGYSEGHLRQEEFRSLFFGNRRTDLAYSFERGKNGVYQATLNNPELLNDPDVVAPKHFESRFINSSNVEKVLEAKLDYAYNLEQGAQGFGFKAGAKLRRTDRTRDREWDERRPSSADRELFPLSEVLLPFDGFNSQLFAGNIPLLFVDIPAARAFALANPGIVAPRESVNITNSINDDYVITEDVNALYLQNVWNGENFRLTAGLRYENTDLLTLGNSKVDGIFEPVTIDAGYSNWLPRADFTYEMTENIRVRLAYSKSVGRADFSDLRPNATISTDSEGNTNISGGNPNLRPRVSDNYDLSVEYYFDDVDGLLAVGLFHKNIKDEIFRRRNVIPGVDEDGLPVSTIITAPANADGAKLTGVEFGLIMNSFDFLPGFLKNFGISANYAYIDSSARFSFIDTGDRDGDGDKTEILFDDLPGLFQQPKHTANIALNYKQGDFEGRVAWNYRGKRLRNIQDDDRREFDRFLLGQGRIDAQIRYWLTDQIRIFAEAKNITGSAAREVAGNKLELTHTFRNVGASFGFGVNFKY